VPNEAQKEKRRIRGLRGPSDESFPCPSDFEDSQEIQRIRARASNLVSIMMLVTGKNTWASKKLNRKALE
jgi:hypothetical protein